MAAKHNASVLDRVKTLEHSPGCEPVSYVPADADDVSRGRLPVLRWGRLPVLCSCGLDDLLRQAAREDRFMRRLFRTLDQHHEELEELTRWWEDFRRGE